MFGGGGGSVLPSDVAARAQNARRFRPLHPTHQPPPNQAPNGHGGYPPQPPPQPQGQPYRPPAPYGADGPAHKPVFRPTFHNSRHQPYAAPQAPQRGGPGPNGQPGPQGGYGAPGGGPQAVHRTQAYAAQGHGQPAQPTVPYQEAYAPPGQHAAFPSPPHDAGYDPWAQGQDAPYDYAAPLHSFPTPPPLYQPYASAPAPQRFYTQPMAPAPTGPPAHLLAGSAKGTGKAEKAGPAAKAKEAYPRKEELVVDPVELADVKRLGKFREEYELLMSAYVAVDSTWVLKEGGRWEVRVRDGTGAILVSLYDPDSHPPAHFALQDRLKVRLLWRNWGLQALNVAKAPPGPLHHLPALLAKTRHTLAQRFPNVFAH